MLDAPIYHEHTGKHCKECARNRKRKSRQRQRQRQPDLGIIKFEAGRVPIFTDPNVLTFLLDPKNNQPCLFAQHPDGTRLGCGGTYFASEGRGYPYVRLGGKTYMLWKVLYVLVKNTLPPRYAIHVCPHKSCVNLAHLKYPEPREALTYRRKGVSGTINKAFPFTLEQWLDHKTKQLFKGAQPKPTADSYLEAMSNLQSAYERVRGE
jgi:hypothetical protein